MLRTGTLFLTRQAEFFADIPSNSGSELGVSLWPCSAPLESFAEPAQPSRFVRRPSGSA